jgi:hypothetical protein
MEAKPVTYLDSKQTLLNTMTIQQTPSPAINFAKKNSI